MRTAVKKAIGVLQQEEGLGATTERAPTHGKRPAASGDAPACFVCVNASGQLNSVDGSILRPGPMVEDTETRLM